MYNVPTKIKGIDCWLQIEIIMTAPTLVNDWELNSPSVYRKKIPPFIWSTQNDPAGFIQAVSH